MVLVMYLFTCGFMCANTNVYSICNIPQNSKCTTTYNNAYTSKLDTGIHVHESRCFASAFISHSLNTAKRLLGMWWYTAKRLYTGTQCMVVVTGHSDEI